MALSTGDNVKCKTIIPYEIQASKYHSFSGEYKEVSITTDLEKLGLTHCNKPIDSNPFIVPPTWNKTEYHKSIS